MLRCWVHLIQSFKVEVLKLYSQKWVISALYVVAVPAVKKLIYCMGIAESGTTYWHDEEKMYKPIECTK